MKRNHVCLLALLISTSGTATAATPDDLTIQPGVLSAEFVFETAPFAQCHASTLEMSGGTLVAAWFAGTREGREDVSIWVARKEDDRWLASVKVADGAVEGDRRYPCWNPVLFQPKDGPLMLFYKVGPNPRAWWGMLTTSADRGKTWSTPRRLPDGIAGPIKNKPIRLAEGALLAGSSTEDQGWRVHMERSDDLGKTWTRTKPLNDGQKIGAIQPTLLVDENDRIVALCRSRQRRIARIESSDGGKTWGEMTLTELPNPNSGIDAVTLADGRHLLVYNHTRLGRSPLNVAVSPDGEKWQSALVLENQSGEYSYPAVIQTADGLVHISYTWKRRRVRHWVVDPAKLKLSELPSG